MNETWILGIQIKNRKGTVRSVQDVLAKFGCTIRTRLGLHEPSEEGDAVEGLILLELTGDPLEFPKLEKELTKIEGTVIRKMVFPV
jgi:hypothetical protein